MLRCRDPPYYRFRTNYYYYYYYYYYSLDYMPTKRHCSRSLIMKLVDRAIPPARLGFFPCRVYYVAVEAEEVEDGGGGGGEGVGGTEIV